MIAIYVFISIALVTAGVVAGALAVVCLGIRRGDHTGGFPAEANDRVTRAARRITGVGTRS